MSKYRSAFSFCFVSVTSIDFICCLQPLIKIEKSLRLSFGFEVSTWLLWLPSCNWIVDMYRLGRGKGGTTLFFGQAEFIQKVWNMLRKIQIKTKTKNQGNSCESKGKNTRRRGERKTQKPKRNLGFGYFLSKLSRTFFLWFSFPTTQKLGFFKIQPNPEYIILPIV